MLKPSCIVTDNERGDQSGANRSTAVADLSADENSREAQIRFCPIRAADGLNGKVNP